MSTKSEIIPGTMNSAVDYNEMSGFTNPGNTASNRRSQIFNQNINVANCMNSAKSVPCLLVAIQGGPRTLMTIMRQLKRNAPILIIRGPGGWSDVIADICHSYDSIKILSQLKQTGCIFKGRKDKTFQSIDYEMNNQTKDYELKFTSEPNKDVYSGILKGTDVPLAVFLIQSLFKHKVLEGSLINFIHVQSAIYILKFKHLISYFNLGQNINELSTIVMEALLSSQYDRDEIFKIGLLNKYPALDYDKAKLIKEVLMHQEIQGSGNYPKSGIMMTKSQHNNIYTDTDADKKSERLGQYFDEAIKYREPKFLDLLQVDLKNGQMYFLMTGNSLIRPGFKTYSIKVWNQS